MSSTRVNTITGGLRCGLFRREQIDGQIAEVTRRYITRGDYFRILGAHARA